MKNLEKVLIVICIIFILLLIGMLSSCATVGEKIPITPPSGLPDSYQSWAVIYSEPDNRHFTMEQKLDPQFWKENIDEPTPPDWFLPGADEKTRMDGWMARNSYHNLSYYSLGQACKKTRTFMSNPNLDDPRSPFAKEGDNFIVVEVLEEDVSGVMELTAFDIAKIGLFQKELASSEGEDFIRALVKKAQRAKFFLGATKREGDWESYSGWKPGGIFGIASRSRQPI